MTRAFVCFPVAFSSSLSEIYSPLTLHSSEKGHTLGSDTLGRTWIPLESVSEALRANANMGACHLRSVLLLLLALTLLAAFSPPLLLSSCRRRTPKTCDLSFPESASDKVRSCSAGAAIALPGKAPVTRPGGAPSSPRGTFKTTRRDKTRRPAWYRTQHTSNYGVLLKADRVCG